MNFIFLIQLLGVNVANGAAEKTVENTGEGFSFFDMALKGGWIMIPLAILSVIAVYIFVERYLAINKAAKEETLFMNSIKDHISNGRVDSALSACKSTEGPLARMIEKGITRLGKPLEDINAAIENVGKLEIYKLEKGLPTLATVAGGAPMLGFLGTVLGMITAFYDMSNAGANLDVSLLSSGIYTALVTTVAGLIVGIIALFGYNILVARVDKVVNKLEASSTDFMDLLNEPVK
ncbi:MAG: biopolymer transporter ExbB [Bacteroidetes bacterium GWF2_38_335]|nr:MAG: biopolymer transporter ExbB [Bacteroidetes bacterium GWF2_38_335]OFY79064.1 MAG: biopolymer transporter ExbB [Bacteroidetes bacterium RIFOXYA12_FULL_38_20]HBS86147.1 biopolymer transporter ExbB [Bacteroidales bacterium]